MLNPQGHFTVAFGDSMGDVPMLEIVDLPVIVRLNNNAIAGYAKSKNWLISDKPLEIINNIRNRL